MKTAQMEYISGYGYYWVTGGKVYQEDQLIPQTCLPIGHTEYGKPWAYQSVEIHIESCSDGFWVMDRLGSYHRHPFRTHDAAALYAKHLKGLNS